MTDFPQPNDSNTPPLVTGDVPAPPHPRWSWRTLVRPRRWGHWSRRRLFGVLAVLVVVATATGAWWTTCGFAGCPSTNELRAWRPTEGGRVLDANGLVLGALVPVKRVNVSLARVPVMVQKAFIAVEDHRFRSHNGVDWRGVLRATLVNVRALGVREGASTITMQLARNVFLAQRASERSVGRKLLEWRYAQLLERALTKDEILERYLNAIYLGNGVYGIEGASRDLFGKSVANVTLAEAAMLAGLPKAPTSYSPRRDRARARARRDLVLSILEREGVASRSAIVAAHAFDVRVARAEWTPSRTNDSWALELVRTSLDSLRDIGALPEGLTNASLVVHTTFDRKAQRAAERAVSRGAAQVDAGRGVWNGGSEPQVQGAFVALDPATGAIRALVGGRRVERGGFNRALLARRQPGSAFKPFVYVAALQQGYTTATVVEDEPISVESGATIWTPANFDEEYAGRITLRQALVRSANAATVRISRDVGIDRVARLAAQLGIQSPLPRVPALALGAGEVTPIELTVAYAPMGNGGWRVTPHMLLRVDDAFGHVVWSGHQPGITRVLDSSDAFLVTSMLRSVVDDGTGRGVRSAGIRGPVAGKTGTTNDGADIWFVGYTPTVVAAVWFGLDAPQPLGEGATGGRFAVPAWSEFVRDGWHSPSRDTAWQPPGTLVSRQIDIASGTLASDWCGESRREWFKPGSEPRDQCTSFSADFSDGWLSEGIRGVISALPAEEVPRPAVPRHARPGRDVERAIGAIARQIGKSHFTQELTRKLMAGLRSATREPSAARERMRQREREMARVERLRERAAEVLEAMPMAPVPPVPQLPPRMPR